MRTARWTISARKQARSYVVPAYRAYQPGREEVFYALEHHGSWESQEVGSKDKERVKALAGRLSHISNGDRQYYICQRRLREGKNFPDNHCRSWMSSNLRLPHPLKPVLPILPKQLHTRRPIRRTVHRPSMQHHQPLKGSIPQINWSPTLLAEVSIQRIPGLGCFVGVLLDQVFTLGEGELGLEEAVVVREG
jgi:hypothetical protein